MSLYDNKIKFTDWENLKTKIDPKAIQESKVIKILSEDKDFVKIIFKPELKNFLVHKGKLSHNNNYSYWDNMLKEINSKICKHILSNYIIPNNHPEMGVELFLPEPKEIQKQMSNENYYNWIPGNFLQEFIKDWINEKS